jgi:hypothetical protein
MEEKENKKPKPPDEDWVAYIPDNEWATLMNLCDKLEQTQTEFQKTMDGANKVKS